MFQIKRQSTDVELRPSFFLRSQWFFCDFGPSLIILIGILSQLAKLLESRKKSQTGFFANKMLKKNYNIQLKGKVFVTTPTPPSLFWWNVSSLNYITNYILQNNFCYVLTVLLDWLKCIYLLKSISFVCNIYFFSIEIFSQ